MRLSVHSGMASVQWLFFLFANTVVVPISIGHAFQLSGQEIAAGMQQTFVWTGIACLLQALVGHKYAIMEGPSGVWWGFILNLAASAASMNISLSLLGGSLATGIILAGIVTLLLGVTGRGNRLKEWFTPSVLFVFFLLLSVELTTVFFKGMVGASGNGSIDPAAASVSLAVIGVVLCLQIGKSKRLGGFSILIGLAFGWILYAIVVPDSPQTSVVSSFNFHLFPWGAPRLEPSIVFAAFLVGMINASNIPATLKGADAFFGTKTPNSRYRATFGVTGAMTVTAGLFGLVPYSPYASSLGFLETTGNANRTPFMIGALLFVTAGIVPAFSALLSHLPLSVGHAVLFAAYLNLFGAAIRQIEGMAFSASTILRLALPVLTGIAIMNTPAEATASLPTLVRPLIANGMLMGILLSLSLEQAARIRRRKCAQLP